MHIFTIWLRFFFIPVFLFSFASLKSNLFWGRLVGIKFFWNFSNRYTTQFYLLIGEHWEIERLESFQWEAMGWPGEYVELESIEERPPTSFMLFLLFPVPPLTGRATGHDEHCLLWLMTTSLPGRTVSTYHNCWLLKDCWLICLHS